MKANVGGNERRYEVKLEVPRQNGMNLNPPCRRFWPSPKNRYPLVNRPNWVEHPTPTSNYFLRVTPALKHYSDIVSGIPSGSVCGIFILTCQYILSDIPSGIYSGILSEHRSRSPAVPTEIWSSRLGPAVPIENLETLTRWGKIPIICNINQYAVCSMHHNFPIA